MKHVLVMGSKKITCLEKKRRKKRYKIKGTLCAELRSCVKVEVAVLGSHP